MCPSIVWQKTRKRLDSGDSRNRFAIHLLRLHIGLGVILPKVDIAEQLAMAKKLFLAAFVLLL